MERAKSFQSKPWLQKVNICCCNPRIFAGRVRLVNRHNLASSIDLGLCNALLYVSLVQMRRWPGWVPVWERGRLGTTVGTKVLAGEGGGSTLGNVLPGPVHPTGTHIHTHMKSLTSGDQYSFLSLVDQSFHPSSCL